MRKRGKKKIKGAEKMKKGINIWSFDSSKTLREKIAFAKKAGFEGIELSLDAEGELSLSSTEKELLEIKKFAEDTGICLPSLATGLFWDYPMTSADPAKVKKACDIVKKQLESAAALGCSTILVIPGLVCADFIENCEVVPYDKAYDRALECVKALSSYAEKCGVKICLENVWNKFLLSPLEMRGFIDAVGSEYVGSYFDVGNVIANGYPEHWIRILGKRIGSVHFKEYRREVGSLAGFVDLLAGDANWPEIMKAFGEIGYNGWAFAEMIPSYKHYNDQIIINTSGAMDRIISGK